MIKKRLLTVSALFVTLSVSAQDYFNHMDLGVSVSSTGIGADIAMPVGDYVRLRAGFTYMPKFHLNSSFGIDFMGDISDDKLRRMKNVMRDFSGQVIRDKVDMQMKPTWTSFKFLVDVFPIPNNKHWSITAGFYAGPSRIGEAINDESAIPMLAAVNMYNNIYAKACLGEYLYNVEFEDGSMHHGDIPFPNEFIKTGMMGMPLGRFADGDRAVMVPSENCLAKAEMEVSKFRPYIGLGYNTTLSKNARWKMAVDAGVLFWGGKPKVYVDNVYKVRSIEEDSQYYYYNTIWLPKDEYGDYCYDGEGNLISIDAPTQRIDLIRDVTGIPGKVGDMVNTVKKFKCWPVVSLTFSYKLF